ncbi:MAG: amidohydrolase family protein [Bacteroidales bacterium]|jgi:cytosine/adenosine deaminase-related metal-dependent hydrolase|nr:amidohydrolase family protein [Bacteroidales bacterium]
MRRISAQYVITNDRPVLRRAVVSAEDDGTITGIMENDGLLTEKQSVEFYNGIIIPGFVNCHCHLELSHLKGEIPEGAGLPEFIMNIRNRRDRNEGDPAVMKKAVMQMADEGIVLCGDICNNASAFSTKENSNIAWHSFIEVFGIDPARAEKRIAEAGQTAEEAGKYGFSYSVTPHSLYSVSLPLLRLLKEYTSENRVTSVHFMESESEKQFLRDNTGSLKESYERSGLLTDDIMTPAGHAEGILDEITLSGNLILVHNTFTDAATVKKVLQRKNTWWCLCPGSNLYVEGRMPPVDMLISEGCELVLGTDSLASNKNLSILSEMKLISEYFPAVRLEEMIRWATLNGARALDKENIFGKIASGMKPGLLLLENADLLNMKLLPETTVKRLL